MTFRRDPHPSADHGQNSTDKPAICRPRNHHAPEPPPPLPTGSNSNGSRGDPQEICLQELQELPRTMTTNGANHHHHHHHSKSTGQAIGAGVHAVVSYSPSSSGYSSIRCSSENVCPGVHCHSSQFPYFNGTGVVASSPVGQCGGNGGYMLASGSCSGLSSAMSTSTTVAGCCYHCIDPKGSMVCNGCASPTASTSSTIISSPALVTVGCCSCCICQHHAHNCCVAIQGKKGIISSECRKIHVPSTIREESESFQSQRSKSVTSCKSTNKWQCTAVWGEEGKACNANCRGVVTASLLKQIRDR